MKLYRIIVSYLKSAVANHLSEKSRLITAAILIGAICGTLTFFLKSLISLTVNLVRTHLSVDGFNFRFLIVPLVGILLASAYQQWIKTDLSHGTTQLQNRIKLHHYGLKSKTIFTSLIGCYLTIGFGGSAGAEGPSVVSGAAVGNWIRKKLNLSPSSTKILLACGAGAGTAGIFMAPVGGFLFTIEVLQMSFSFLSMTAILAASLTSFTVGCFLCDFDWTMAFRLYQSPSFGGGMVFPILLMSALCGLYCLYYNKSRAFTTTRLHAISNVWKRNLIAGGSLAIMIFFMPAIFGEGYDVIDAVISGNEHSIFQFSPLHILTQNHIWLLIGVTVILIIKGFAVAATNSGGGAAGEFAPTLFAGALFGYLYASLFDTLLGIHIPFQQFTLMGMAAIMGGAMRAPLMATFLTAEFTLTYNYIPFYLVASSISHLMATQPWRRFMNRNTSTPSGE